MDVGGDFIFTEVDSFGKYRYLSISNSMEAIGYAFKLAERG